MLRSPVTPRSRSSPPSKNLCLPNAESVLQTPFKAPLASFSIGNSSHIRKPTLPHRRSELGSQKQSHHFVPYTAPCSPEQRSFRFTSPRTPTSLLSTCSPVFSFGPSAQHPTPSLDEPPSLAWNSIPATATSSTIALASTYRASSVRRLPKHSYPYSSSIFVCSTCGNSDGIRTTRPFFR